MLLASFLFLFLFKISFQDFFSRFHFAPKNGWKILWKHETNSMKWKHRPKRLG